MGHSQSRYQKKICSEQEAVVGHKATMVVTLRNHSGNTHTALLHIRRRRHRYIWSIDMAPEAPSQIGRHMSSWFGHRGVVNRLLISPAPPDLSPRLSLMSVLKPEPPPHSELRASHEVGWGQWLSPRCDGTQWISTSASALSRSHKLCSHKSRCPASPEALRHWWWRHFADHSTIPFEDNLRVQYHDQAIRSVRWIWWVGVRHKKCTFSCLHVSISVSSCLQVCTCACYVAPVIKPPQARAKG